LRADFVNAAAGTLGIERRDLVEKDVLLHQILLDLSRDEFFSDNFAFKGGTCLIKCYYGYERFSEDIDFTWRDQRVFAGKSQSAIRDHLSRVIDQTGAAFERIAEKHGLEFKCKKNNRDFVELGGSNKSCTFKIWYDSQILGHKSYIKVQINFVEHLCFKLKRSRAKSLLTTGNSELRKLFPEYREYSSAVSLDVYDIREILAEKVRALMTRRGTKARDFLDVYLINKHYKIRPEQIEECIIKKTNFALGLYEKFRSNFKDKLKLLETGKLFEWGQEKGLLLSDISEKDFYSFLDQFQKFLSMVVKKLQS
jgi:predicted nucleotidyltransferase component of viral defense system